jgi:hypothetical protein
LPTIPSYRGRFLKDHSVVEDLGVAAVEAWLTANQPTARQPGDIRARERAQPEDQ